MPHPPLPSLFVDEPVLCDKCGREFSIVIYRVVTVDDVQVRTLIDRDGDVVYELVKVCKSCKTVFHWHSKEQAMVKAEAVYQMAFDLLNALYQPAESAIIKGENSTG